MKPGTAGKGKLDERWGDGVFLGTIGESSGICIGTKDGIVKARTFARRGEEDRWSRKEVDEMVGVPWEQILGKGMREANSRAHIAGAGAGEDIIAAPQMREAMPRRMRFDMDDLDKYGFTTGCPGCKATNRGEFSVNHSEECRRRVEEKMRADVPERYSRTLVRLAEGTLLKEGRGDERKTRDFEFRKNMKQKEDRKEERKEDIKRKAETMKRDSGDKGPYPPSEDRRKGASQGGVYGHTEDMELLEMRYRQRRVVQILNGVCRPKPQAKHRGNGSSKQGIPCLRKKRKRKRIIERGKPKTEVCSRRKRTEEDCTRMDARQEATSTRP